MNKYEEELGNCVKFVEQEDGKKSATVTPGYGCSATVGFNPFYPMSVTLADACINRRNVKHEFTHLLGFMHEHTRKDRGKNLEIMFENIYSSCKKGFYMKSLMYPNSLW